MEFKFINLFSEEFLKKFKNRVSDAKQSGDKEEWASKVNGLMREYIQDVKADDVDEWEANIDQNESVKVKQAVTILKENGYIVKGH